MNINNMFANLVQKEIICDDLSHSHSGRGNIWIVIWAIPMRMLKNAQSEKSDVMIFETLIKICQWHFRLFSISFKKLIFELISAFKYLRKSIQNMYSIFFEKDDLGN